MCAQPAAGYHFGAFTCEGCKVSLVGGSVGVRLSNMTSVDVLSSKYCQHRRIFTKQTNEKKRKQMGGAAIMCEEINAP